jgi:hypothetical protein
MRIYFNKTIFDPSPRKSLPHGWRALDRDSTTGRPPAGNPATRLRPVPRDKRQMRERQGLRTYRVTPKSCVDGGLCHQI